jgi:peptidoglycan/xylan/chitin deacetylase (PgdA/CDA1 family)
MRYLTISADQFEQQLDQLAASGLATGDFDALAAVVEGRLRNPTAFLTFDDGFRDNYTRMLPILRERGLSAFVFVIPPLVDAGSPLAWPEVAPAQRRHPETMLSVTWPMVEEMAASGIEIGSHTLTHPHLPTLAQEELHDELLDSRRRIEERLGSCRTIAYPFGEWSPRVARAAGECGYTYAFTLPTFTGQRNAGPLTIPRLNVDYRDGTHQFRLKLGRPAKSLLLSPTVTRLRRSIRRRRRP